MRAYTRYGKTVRTTQIVLQGLLIYPPLPIGWSRFHRTRNPIGVADVCLFVCLVAPMDAQVDRSQAGLLVPRNVLHAPLGCSAVPNRLRCIRSCTTIRLWHDGSSNHSGANDDALALVVTRVMSFDLMSFDLMSFDLIWFDLIWCHLIWFDLMSFHVISLFFPVISLFFPVISYHALPCPAVDDPSVSDTMRHWSGDSETRCI